jgi:hypothetical protein
MNEGCAPKHARTRAGVMGVRRGRACAWASSGRTAWTAGSGARTSRTWPASPGSPGRARSPSSSPAGAFPPLCLPSLLRPRQRSYLFSLHMRAASACHHCSGVLLLHGRYLAECGWGPGKRFEGGAVLTQRRYEDDRDEGEWFLYTGSGGRDLSGNKRVTKVRSCDTPMLQQLTPGQPVLSRI